jgi:hypothetical protein
MLPFCTHISLKIAGSLNVDTYILAPADALDVEKLALANDDIKVASYVIVHNSEMLYLPGEESCINTRTCSMLCS